VSRGNSRLEPALADGVSVGGDVAVEPTSQAAEYRQCSQSSDRPGDREQACQPRDGIPTDIHFALGCHNVQLPQAIVQVEGRLDTEKDFRADGNRFRSALGVELLHPGDPGLAGRALAVIKDNELLCPWQSLLNWHTVC